jgi:hypothetical protein
MFASDIFHLAITVTDSTQIEQCGLIEKYTSNKNHVWTVLFVNKLGTKWRVMKYESKIVNFFMWLRH